MLEDSLPSFIHLTDMVQAGEGFGIGARHHARLTQTARSPLCCRPRHTNSTAARLSIRRMWSLRVAEE